MMPGRPFLFSPVLALPVRAAVVVSMPDFDAYQRAVRIRTYSSAPPRPANPASPGEPARK